MDWSNAVSKINPFVVKIHTQSQWGTGFVFWQNQELCCIATAAHVIKNANIEGWEQPIYITQPDGNTARLNPVNRTIKANLNEDINGDSAAILIYKNCINLPPDCLPLWDFSREIPIGTEIGWLGYPRVVDNRITQPCFFSGTLSNNFTDLEQYAIDGVAINGVSGGPVFCKLGENPPSVIGTLSSYFPNRIQSDSGLESLPGIAVSHSFSAFIPISEDLDRLDKASEIIS